MHATREAGTVIMDPDFRRAAVRIMAGEYFVTRESLGITTVLGSCVSACIRDPYARVGGMNHFLLPVQANAEFEGPRAIVSAAARYGVQAMELTINELLRCGARRERLEAKLFGGAAVLDGMIRANIGGRNAAFARDFLEREAIRVAAADLGGKYPRKIFYDPMSGEAFVKYLGARDDAAIVQRERTYLRAVSQQAPPPADVELFSADAP
jgi:chemotaxis protein CheD